MPQQTAASFLSFPFNPLQIASETLTDLATSGYQSEGSRQTYSTTSSSHSSPSRSSSPPSSRPSSTSLSSMSSASSPSPSSPYTFGAQSGMPGTPSGSGMPGMMASRPTALPPHLAGSGGRSQRPAASRGVTSVTSHPAPEMYSPMVSGLDWDVQSQP